VSTRKLLLLSPLKLNFTAPQSQFILSSLTPELPQLVTPGAAVTTTNSINMPNAIITFALRGAQVLFSVVVLGLSVGLIMDHKTGGLPATLGYVAFVGGISLLGAFIGIAAHWVELLQGIIGAGIDAFLTVLNIAGGIVSNLFYYSLMYVANTEIARRIQNEGNKLR